jgi:RNA polymerase sigma-70 factor, ECF subfamily
MADEGPKAAPPNAHPEELYPGAELRNILRRELQELQPGLRVVFVLRDIEGLSADETADVLELTPVAIKARLWRARMELRERLSRYFGIHKLRPSSVATSAETKG